MTIEQRLIALTDADKNWAIVRNRLVDRRKGDGPTRFRVYAWAEGSLMPTDASEVFDDLESAVDWIEAQATP